MHPTGKKCPLYVTSKNKIKWKANEQKQEQRHLHSLRLGLGAWMLCLLGLPHCPPCHPPCQPPFLCDCLLTHRTVVHQGLHSLSSLGLRQASDALLLFTFSSSKGTPSLAIAAYLNPPSHFILPVHNLWDWDKSKNEWNTTHIPECEDIYLTKKHHN